MMGVVVDDMRSQDPTPVGNLLGSAVPTLAAGLLELRIRREWPQLVGPEIARRCQPGALRNGTLELTVDNSPWLHELALREAELLGRLADGYGRDAVRALRLSLGAVRPEPAAVPRRRARTEARLTEDEIRMVDAAASVITEPELRGAARRLLEKACVAARARTARP